MKWLIELYKKYMNGARANYFPLFGRKPNHPRNLNEAFVAVDTLVSADEKDIFLEWSEEKFVARTPHSLGRLIRNQWQLWDGKSPLHKWFLRSDIWHADDMSGIILTSYWRHIHKQPLNIRSQFDAYRAYWAKQDEH